MRQERLRTYSNALLKTRRRKNLCRVALANVNGTMASLRPSASTSTRRLPDATKVAAVTFGSACTRDEHSLPLCGQLALAGTLDEVHFAEVGAVEALEEIPVSFWAAILDRLTGLYCCLELEGEVGPFRSLFEQGVQIRDHGAQPS